MEKESIVGEITVPFIAGAEMSNSGANFESLLPASVVSSSAEEDVTEVEGTIEPAITGNRPQINSFTFLQKGAATVKPPTGAAAVGVTQVLIQVKQNSAGGHALTTSGITWNGGEPVWKTTANAVNNVWIFTKNGSTWEGEGPEQGATGATGPTGPEAVGPNKLWLPSEVVVFEEPGSATTEKKAMLGANYDPAICRAALVLATGVPMCSAILLPAETTVHGIIICIAGEETAADRTHMFLALLNSAREHVALTGDYTSETNTPLKINVGCRGFPLTAPYKTGASPALFYATVCQTVSAGVCSELVTAEAQNAAMISSNATPPRQFSGAGGVTTPATLPSPVVPTTYERKPFFVGYW